MELGAAIATKAAEQVAGKAFGMEADQRSWAIGWCMGRVTDDDGEVFDPGVCPAKCDDPRVGGRSKWYPRLRDNSERAGDSVGIGKDVIGFDGEETEGGCAFLRITAR